MGLMLLLLGKHADKWMCYNLIANVSDQCLVGLYLSNLIDYYTLPIGIE